ncbi:MAG: CPBP family intramembrane glutamic endopeptidase [Bacteroidota bacterium]
MKKERLFTGIVLFVLGMIGVFSLLSMEVTLPAEAERIVAEQFTSQQLKWLSLINPTVSLIITVVVGTLLHEKVNLDLPLIKGLIKKEKRGNIQRIILFGIAGGIIAGIFILMIGAAYEPLLSQEFLKLGENIHTSLVVRFLYGGITEEILMRFGLMTFFVWLLSKMFKSLNVKIYWGGILLAALLFAVGHFPVVFQAVGSPSALLLSYIIVGNSLGGIIFGWLYWKRGLESAFIAHIFAHVVMAALSFN